MDLGKDTLSVDSPSGFEEAGLTAYAVAAEFNLSAFPANMPKWLVDRIGREADLAHRVEGAERFFNAAATGTTEIRLRIKREKEAEDDAVASLSAVIAEGRKREQEEWNRTRSTVAGVTMTGAEWRQLANRLRSDEELHRKVVDAFKARGLSAAEAEHRYDRVADVAEIAAIPPSQRTEEQAERLEKANADPTFKRDMEDAAKAAQLDASQRPSPELAQVTERMSDHSAAATSPSIDRRVVAIEGLGF